MAAAPRLTVAAAVCAFALSLSVCGGGGVKTPTQPTPVVPPAQPAPSILRGTVVQTGSGTPVEGATLTFSPPAATTSPPVATGPGGVWEYTLPSPLAATLLVEVSAPGYLTRRTYVRSTLGTRSDVVIDVLRDAAPFSLTYYRELVRDLFDRPSDPPEPLRRWTSAPNFYIAKHNPRTGTDILQSEVDVLIAAIREAVPQMTGERYEAAEIEVGSEDRPPRPGFINVKFVNEPDADYCGRAFVGADPGLITINYGIDGCRTTCGGFAPRTVAHEVGHALGFYHVAQGAVLNTSWSQRDCRVTRFSDAERHHARLAYARMPGNRDPDEDPSTAALSQSGVAPPIEIRCR